MDNYPVACYSLILGFSEIYVDLSSMMVGLENTLRSIQPGLMKYEIWCLVLNPQNQVIVGSTLW